MSAVTDRIAKYLPGTPRLNPDPEAVRRLEEASRRYERGVDAELERRTSLDEPDVSILVIDCADRGWRWIGFPIEGRGPAREGWAGSREEALDDALAACPGRQVIRIA